MPVFPQDLVLNLAVPTEEIAMTLFRNALLRLPLAQASCCRGQTHHQSLARALYYHTIRWQAGLVPPPPDDFVSLEPSFTNLACAKALRPALQPSGHSSSQCNCIPLQFNFPYFG